MTDLQKAYRAIRTRAVHNTNARSGYDSAAFDADVAKVLSRYADLDAEPVHYVAAATRVRHFCGRCAGSGMYVTGTLNGKVTGPGGDCFRCGGKGTQDDADYRRNYGFDCKALDAVARDMAREHADAVDVSGGRYDDERDAIDIDADNDHADAVDRGRDA